MYTIYKSISSRNAKTSFSIKLDHIYDVLALNNPKCNDYIDVIYPAELEIKDAADAPTGANYIDRRLEFDEDVKFTLDAKRDDCSVINLISL